MKSRSTASRGGADVGNGACSKNTHRARDRHASPRNSSRDGMTGGGSDSVVFGRRLSLSLAAHDVKRSFRSPRRPPGDGAELHRQRAALLTRCNVWMGGQRELKDGAAGRIGASPTIVRGALRRSNGRSTGQAPSRSLWSCGRRLKRFSTAAGANPGPESRTVTSTSPDSVLPVVISNSLDPSLISLMASRALRIKLSITCCSSTRSP